MKKRNYLVAVLFFIPLVTGCISGFNLREGIQSYVAQDYRKAFIRLVPEAEKGQPDAQYAVGYMYYYGQGVTENRERGWFWINLAARNGQPEAIEAVKILEQGSVKKAQIFQGKNLQHFPVDKGMY